MTNKEIFAKEVTDMVDLIDEAQLTKLIHSIYESMTRKELTELLNTGRASIIIGYALREYAIEIADDTYEEHNRTYRRREREANEREANEREF